MIRILIVDDSKTETLLLRSLFEKEEDIEVVGCAYDGKEAVKLTEQLKPDLITMDLAMPILDGFEATQLIMSQHPTPIVIISSRLDNYSLNSSYKALSAGALAVLDKPHFHSAAFEAEKNRILETVRSMAEIKVIRRRFRTPTKKALPQKLNPRIEPREFEIIAIGSSVGGPQALRVILSKLPKDFPLPIVIVQHMTEGFIRGFTEWLNKHTALHIKEAADFEVLRGGTVYFAPDHHHLEIKRNKQGLMAKLIEGSPVSGFYPSATVLLKSVAQVAKHKAVGVLLTGMGNDGAAGLLDLKKAQGHTLTQDAESAVVFGMAGVAHALGAVDRTVELDKIAEYLVALAVKKCERSS